MPNRRRGNRRGRGHGHDGGGSGSQGPPQNGGDQEEKAGSSGGSAQSNGQEEKEETWGAPVDPVTGRTLNLRPFLRCKLEGHDLFAMMSNVIPAPFMTTKTMEELNLTRRLNQNVTGSCWGPFGDTYPIVGVLEGLNVWFSDKLQFTCDFYVNENEHYEALLFNMGTFFQLGCKNPFGLADPTTRSFRFERGNGTVVNIPCVKFRDELPTMARRCTMSPLFGYRLNNTVAGQDAVM